jgi:hypothetical protein
LGLLDSSEEHPHSKLRRYIITAVTFLILVTLGAWHLLRFHTEKKTVAEFLTTLSAGQMEQAYHLWKPQPSYSYNDFLDDWGPNGYYGPVKSFRVVATERLKGASGVVVVVAVSPYQPFPADDDVTKQNKTKEVKIWVEFKDQSMSYPP